MENKQNKGFDNVEEYFQAQPEEVRETLELLRFTIKSTVPEAEEAISYQMPSFRFHGMLAWYAVFKNHYGFFVLPENLLKFKEKLTSYEISKSSISFPMDKPIPLNLVKEIVKYAAKENLRKKLLKEALKKKKINFK